MKLEIRYDRATLTTAAVKFEEFPDALRDELRDVVNQLAQEAFGRVAALVPRRSGRLASLEQVTMKSDASGVSATVNFAGGDATGNDFAKAGALEYGSRGAPFAVSGYTQTRTSVFGRALAAPTTALVAAYSRPGGIAAESFSTPVAAAMQAEALSRINAVVERAIARANED